MKKLILFILLLVIIAGCSNTGKSDPQPPATNEKEIKETETPKEEEIINPTVEPTPEPVKEKKLTNDEQLALDFINIYLNGLDVEAKKQFVIDHVNDDVKIIFELGASSVSEEDSMINGPVVKGSSSYEESGMNGTIVLVSGENDKEVIILVVNGEIGWGYNSDSNDEEEKKVFDDLKSRIK